MWCRYWAARNTCPKCSYRWTNDLTSQVTATATVTTTETATMTVTATVTVTRTTISKWFILIVQVMNLRKVDFFWINREQRSFEW